MEAKVVQIGNSKGIRIPQKILGQCHIEDSVDLSVKNGALILKPIKKMPREGWALQAQKMQEAGDDRLIIPDVFADDQELSW